jgi:hypothetical protein
MYDLTRPHKQPKRYFVAVSSDGQFTATRSSESRIYSHAVIALASHWSGDVYSYWCSRLDLAEKQLRQTKRWEANTFPYELVETKEVSPREFRQIRKDIKAKAKARLEAEQSVSG